MSLSSVARHQEILKRLRDGGHVSARALQRDFEVTPMTVWRDLRGLEEQGLLRRVRGGAMSSGGAQTEPDFEAKTVTAQSAKDRIAALAVATFVRDGDTVALEGGTTVASLVPYLPHSRVSVVTNSLPVALRLRRDRPALPVSLPGGWMSPVSGNLCGPEAVRRMAQWSASVCFISATGFDIQRGPTDPNPLEIEAKRALTQGARQVVLLLDASKFGCTSACVTLHPRHVHALVTDVAPPPDIADWLTGHGVRILVAEG
jgi:DeoR/GlpR family transcriptional regulator of sugar metabolism